MWRKRGGGDLGVARKFYGDGRRTTLGVRGPQKPDVVAPS
jgi:hypothetical protein